MAGHVVATPGGRQELSLGGRIAASRFAPVAAALVAIWLAVLVASVFAPVMITGTNHERLAVAALGDWLWGGLDSGLLLLAAAFARPERAPVWWMIAVIVAAIWLVVALASLFAPSMVTGTDPTTIPIMAILAPIVGSIVTAFLAVFAAGMGAGNAA